MNDYTSAQVVDKELDGFCLDPFNVGEFGAVIESVALTTEWLRVFENTYVPPETVMNVLGTEFVGNPERAATTIRAYCSGLAPCEGLDLGDVLVSNLKNRPDYVIDRLVHIVIASGMIEEGLKARAADAEGLPWESPFGEGSFFDYGLERDDEIPEECRPRPQRAMLPFGDKPDDIPF